MSAAPLFSHKMMSERLTRLRLIEAPRRAKNGLGVAGEMLLRDAVETEPKAPTDTTSLIGSAAVFVDGVKVFDSPYGVPGTASRYDPTKVYTDYRAAEGNPPPGTNIHEAAVVFNAPYAAQQHEMWPHKWEPGAGMHFISTKIGMFIAKYMDAIYDKINMGPVGSPDPNASR